MRGTSKLRPRRPIHNDIDNSELNTFHVEKAQVEPHETNNVKEKKECASEIKKIIESSDETEIDGSDTSDSIYDSTLDKSEVEASSKLNFNETRQYKSYVTVTCIAVMAILFVLSLQALNTTENNEHYSLESIKANFSSQDEELWGDFHAGVQDLVDLDKVAVFIFLYTREAESTLDKLVLGLSHYAVCAIRNCSEQPIVISDKELNSEQVAEDYGLFIEKYTNRLKASGVMVVNHLENVLGVSAQAFHTLCDEYTPVAPKSLFIFTLKVDQLPGKNRMRFTEKYLKQKWTDVKPDVLTALITRITSMVVEINP